MKLTVTYDWTQTNVIPPRCRNPRSIHHEGLTLDVDLRVLTDSEAPVALRVPTLYNGTKDLRWFDGALWVRYLPVSHQTEDTILGSAEFPLEPRHTGWSHIVPATEQLAEVEAKLQEHYAGFIAVDSVIYVHASEPTYNVRSGRGYYSDNAGGAWLHISEERPGTEGRNYSALDLDLALADLQSMFDARPTMQTNIAGDEVEHIEVLIPEAVQFQTMSRLETIGEVGTALLTKMVTEAQGHEADEDTPTLVADTVDAMVELDGWAQTLATMRRSYDPEGAVTARIRDAMGHAGVATDAPTIVRTVYVFEMLHRADEQPKSLHNAINEAEGGHAVGQTLSEVTTSLADRLVPAALRRLGNDGEFFAVDLDAESYFA